MKKNNLFIIILILLIHSGCKKEDGAGRVDIKTLFSDKTWTGEFKYASRPIAEPFCIRFNGAGTFTWQELDGEYNGTFETNNDDKTIKITFGSGTAFSATVTDDNRLTEITYSGSYAWAINNLELNNNATRELATTQWKGTYYSPVFGTGPAEINFKTSTTLDYLFPLFVTSGRNIPYQRNKAAIVFRTSGALFFGVISSRDNKLMNGIFESAGGYYYSWRVTKQ
jgi:hypothetical protein